QLCYFSIYYKLSQLYSFLPFIKRNFSTHSFISTWISENSGFDEVKTNNGKWGEISLHNLYDVDGFIGYMNKYNPSETFY
ncbi:MAG: hypothetical protein O2U61_04915, partial [Candidatus Bathyarchaeota archaeon]|nr:hypothetical protein [Candidatus Bathyarchaeota archaeon]